LSQYISKLNDKTFTVNYDASTNTYSITGHDAADTTTTEKTAGTLTEDELAALAR
jgi:type IV pilus assembly protein PilA